MIPIIERDGRYFVQCEDGELERTPEQLRLFTERLETNSNLFKERLTAWENKFKNSCLATGKTPKNSWDYLYIDDHMQAMKQLCQQEFNEGNSLENCSKMCDMAISKLKMERAAPNTDKDLIKYYLAGWKDIRLFISLFPVPSATRAAAAVSEWSALLCQPEKFGLTELLAAFEDVGLLSDDGKPTEWGLRCKGAWAGALDALTAPPFALLTVNALAVGRCLARWGVKVSPNTLRNNTGVEADNTRKAMKRTLAKLTE